MRFFKHTARAKFTAPDNGNAGYELHTPIEVGILSYKTIGYGNNHEDYTNYHLTVIDTEISVEIPVGYVGIICDKSSVGVGNPAKGLWGAVTVVGGIINSSYRGSIKVGLLNLGNRTQIFEAGQKIAQLLVVPCYTLRLTEVDFLEHLSKTERGNDGFGSTGKF